MAAWEDCPSVEPSSITRAYEAIRHYVKRTDLIFSGELSRLASSQSPRSLCFDSLESEKDGVLPLQLKVFFKCENLQLTGAFKVRGAFNAILRLVEQHGLASLVEKGVTTVSSGNHAQALALAASTFGVPAFIVMPRGSTRSKVDGVAGILGVTEISDMGGTGSSGGMIIFCGDSNEDKVAAGRSVTLERGCIFVPPYEHPDIICGQGTCGQELEEQFLESHSDPGAPAGPDITVVPLGGGGLLGGIATWFSNRPNTRVFGVEPSYQGADDGRRGLRQGKRIEKVSSRTVADGLRSTVGALNFEIIRDKAKVTDVFAVGEEEILMAMKLLRQHTGMRIEPSGCVPLAAFLFNDDFRKQAAILQAERGGNVISVVAVCSGGNTSDDVLLQGQPLPVEGRF